MAVLFLLCFSNLLHSDFSIVSKVTIFVVILWNNPPFFYLSWVARVVFTKHLVFPVPLGGSHVPYSSLGIYEYSYMIIRIVLLTLNGSQKSEHSEYDGTLGGLNKYSSSDDKQTNKSQTSLQSLVYPWLYYATRACALGSVEDPAVRYRDPTLGLGHPFS